MAYQAWSVVFGEQPSASKWNILGTNDAGFNDGSAIGDDAILQRHIADDQILPEQLTLEARAFYEIGRTTLASAGDTITATFPAMEFLLVIFRAIATGGTLDTTLIVNGDSGANYAVQYSVQHGAQTSAPSSSNFPIESGATQSGGVNANRMYLWNPSGADKLAFVKNVSQSDGITAAQVPRTLDGQFSWNNNNQVTSISWINGGTGDFAIGSEMIVMGHE